MTPLPAAYQLKISLVDSTPEIWRQVLVPGQIDLGTLHTVIQLAMGWENLHAYAFHTGSGNQKVTYESSHLLVDLLSKNDAIYYTYDFESGWLHRITLEPESALSQGDPAVDPAVDPVRSQVLPTCLGGEEACPPEGTGGVWGYEEFLDRLDDPEAPDYIALIEKYGDFDPGLFDVAEANARLQANPLQISTSF